MQALLEFKSKHRQVDCIVGENSLPLGDWSHLLVGVTRLLYRRLGLDACLLKVSPC